MMSQFEHLQIPPLSILKQKGYNLFTQEYKKDSAAKVKLPDFNNPSSKRYMNEDIVRSA